ncbi:glycosyltransferase family 4 protein [Allorhizobium sp. BGMRC 0089]|uniref:glycosyltransferase family 4 protein n=1 Tax=Allorhizobium sonneratiae TaxID=2934936 RepID=UPI00203320FC|nr:glycosyltransferase family 4 protein [Allorhizobium sonneratiae]MCM2293297.1 glycosyltransferase family 4 protein [Allorhizobium sonneratiae]
MKIAMLLSCGSFEGYFGRFQNQTVQSYLQTYRNDWCWYYGAGLVENGIKPILYIPSLQQDGLHETDTGIAVRFLPLAGWYRPFERVWLKRVCRTNPYTLYADERLNTMAFMPALQSAMVEDDIALLYIQEYWSGRFDHITARVNRPVTAADHGGVAKGVLKWFKRSAFSKTQAIYCQTANECDIVRRYGGRPILQPNGCDLSQFFPLPTASRARSILTVARLINRQKRTSDLIAALALLPEDWTLDIVGAGPDLGLLQRCAATHGVTGRVKFHGFLSRQTIRSMMQTCGVYAMPSANEAVALAALEAMGCGAAVVLSRIRSFQMLVEDGVNGLLVDVGDPSALAKAIETAWTMKERLGKAAVDTVEHHYDTRKLYKNLAATLRDQASSQVEMQAAE